MTHSTYLLHIVLMVIPFLPPLAVTGFTASLPQRQYGGTTSVSSMIAMVPLSNEEIFARAQQRKAAEEEEQAPPPMLFDEDMLKDMQAALLLLERRAKEGPGALSLTEVDDLDGKLGKIIHEMRVNEHLKPSRPTRTEEPSAPSAISTPSNPYPAAAATQSQSASPRAESRQAGPMVIDMDTPSDEGAEYNGHGGMGQAAGTRNTYIIPGMDEMSPEEYQRELQRSVIERQAERKRSGVTGNRSTWDYLNQLTGEKGVLKTSEKTTMKAAWRPSK
jgi:hypothetical protein